MGGFDYALLALIAAWLVIAVIRSRKRRLRGELRGLYSSVQAKKEIKKESMTARAFAQKPGPVFAVCIL